MRLKDMLFFKSAAWFTKYILRKEIPMFFVETIITPIKILKVDIDSMKVSYRVNQYITTDAKEYSEIINESESYIENYDVVRSNDSIFITRVDEKGECVYVNTNGKMVEVMRDIFNGGQTIDKLIFRSKIDVGTYKEGYLEAVEPIEIPINVASIVGN